MSSIYLSDSDNVEYSDELKFDNQSSFLKYATKPINNPNNTIDHSSNSAFVESPPEYNFLSLLEMHKIIQDQNRVVNPIPVSASTSSSSENLPSKNLRNSFDSSVSHYLRPFSSISNSMTRSFSPAPSFSIIRPQSMNTGISVVFPVRKERNIKSNISSKEVFHSKSTGGHNFNSKNRVSSIPNPYIPHYFNEVTRDCEKEKSNSLVKINLNFRKSKSKTVNYLGKQYSENMKILNPTSENNNNTNNNSKNNDKNNNFLTILPSSSYSPTHPNIPSSSSVYSHSSSSPLIAVDS
jgi:hypothetical protein